MNPASATSRPVAFYAPLKAPDHPVPSGDRAMARQLLHLLAHAGFAPRLASRFRSFDPVGDAERAERLAESARPEVTALVDSLGKAPPAFWFTYHVYYKAPDLIGPHVARALGIPYVIAEGTRSPRRADGPWRVGHRQSEFALDAADLVFVLSARDLPRLLEFRPPRQRLAELPPFVDAAEWPEIPAPSSGAGPLRLLTVAMMRGGDKLASYLLLARALARAELPDWRLDIVGDGATRAEIEAAFAPFGSRVRFLGLVTDRALLGRLYAQADLLVWPAVNEAFGMVFLEAALHGCPALAGRTDGVAGVVRHAETGWLSPPEDAEAFAADLARLATDDVLRRRLGAAARAFARGERSLEAASARLAADIAGLLNSRSPAP